MISDLRDAPTSGLDCDILIVGAGAAGISLAARLDDGKRQIILAEGGSRRRDAAAQSLFAARQVGEAFAAHEGRYRVFGGTTTAWTGRCAPLDALDFASRPWIAESGWPIRAEDLSFWYNEAAAICGFRSGWDDEPSVLATVQDLPERPAELAPFVWKFWGTGRNRYQDFGKRFEATFRRSSTLRVLLRANCVGLLASDHANAVAGAKLRGADGKEITVRAKHVVLCCGAIENTRLLLNAAEDLPALLAEVRPVLGRYFMQHPRAVTATIAADSRQAVQLQMLFNRFKRARGRYFETGFCMTSSAQQDLELVNASAVLRYAASSPFQPRELLEIDRVLASTARRIRGHEPLLGTVTASLVVDLEQTPDRESKILLEQERDAIGLRRAVIDWRIGTQERKTSYRFSQAICDWIERLGLGRPVLAKHIAVDGALRSEQMRENYHHLGATRMSATAINGVVDPNLCVHGTRNLYACGGSVLPTGGHANPTLTIVALALRLGTFLQLNSHASNGQ